MGFCNRYIKYDNFGSLLLEHIVEHKPLISWRVNTYLIYAHFVRYDQKTHHDNHLMQLSFLQNCEGNGNQS